MIKIDINNVLNFVQKDDIISYESEIHKHYKALFNKTGKGNDFLGWINLPKEMLESDIISDIQATAKKLQEKSEIFVVIGIGGSYLGARAVIEALQDSFSQYKENSAPQIIYAGQNISEDYLSELMEMLDEKDYSVTVISKSGTTTEPALAFRLIKQHLENKYGKQEASERIVAITDKEKGALKKLSDEQGYKTFVVPDDVGGRYSVLTPVGLLPIAIAGFDIKKLVEGALKMQEFAATEHPITEDPIALYAATRNSLYQTGKHIEIMVNYQPKLQYFTEWWKQLYGESEGKQQKGIFPAGVNFTTDLHSMGQYVQEGLRILFETVVTIEKPNRELTVPKDELNLDGLNYLSGKPIDEVNKKAELATVLAHVDGGVPNIRISIPELNEFYIGEMIYFYEMACAISGYILDVNPFDQPGVEAYKKNMFALLGKPGFEKETEEIQKRIS
ncbi:MAG: glucose-6-phosphate isomerase [Bacteroidota bacterium]|nr:glucose-6-phosphate isomerase [Bacteroidota bacterium]